MKTLLILGVAAIVLLTLGFVFVQQNPDNFFLTTLQSNDEKSMAQKEVIEPEKLSPLEEVKKDHSDCQFGFEFLKDLASFIAPDDKKMPMHLQFQRPFVGAIRQGTLCADSMDALEGDTVGISPCHGHGRNQEWTFTEMKQIRNEGHGTLCLTMDGQLQGKRKLILFQNCNNVNIKQKWQFDNERKQIMPTVNPRLCVARKQSVLMLVKCDQSSKEQKWNVVLTEILNIELQSMKYS